MAALRDYPLLLLVVVVPVLYGLVELGHRLARRRGGEEDALHEQFGMARDNAAMLLSLLLGFTLALAMQRYDLRWQQAVEEAAAIGTAQLRVDVLPEPARTDARRMFKDYIDARVAFGAVGFDEDELVRERAKASKIETDLWRSAVAAAREDRTPVMALYLASLNQAIDASDRRLAGLENRIPRTVWVMLGLLAMFTSLMVGLSMRKRSLTAMLLPPLLVAIVGLLIAELDTPGRGVIRGDVRAIARLQAP